MKAKRAVVLLSGGLDSTTTLAISKHEGFEVFALTFQYGQRHEVEVHAARRVAEAFGVQEHVVVEIDLRLFGGSALTADLEIPKGRSAEAMTAEIPITYVPARNTIFLSYALAWTEVLNAWDIFIGVSSIDYSGYPDCRPAFIKSFEDLSRVATKKGVQSDESVRIHSPLINLTKAETIRRGLDLNVDYGLTHSCYDPAPSGEPCGQCDSCQLRLKGFAEAGSQDPLTYQRQAAISS